MIFVIVRIMLVVTIVSILVFICGLRTMAMANMVISLNSFLRCDAVNRFGQKAVWHNSANFALNHLH